MTSRQKCTGCPESLRLQILLYHGGKHLEVNQGVLFLQSAADGRDVSLFPSACMPCLQTVRYTCMPATHLGGRVLDGQAPEKPQDKRQRWARQKLFPDVGIQTAEQRKAHEWAQGDKAT